MPGKTQKAEARCPVVADDGEHCQRALHPEEPDAHQFGVAATRPIDGGRHWSYWIKIVQNARNALIGYELNYTSNAQKLTQVAIILGLTTIPSDVPGQLIFSDDETAKAEIYKPNPEESAR